MATNTEDAQRQAKVTPQEWAFALEQVRKGNTLLAEQLLALRSDERHRVLLRLKLRSAKDDPDQQKAAKAEAASETEAWFDAQLATLRERAEKALASGNHGTDGGQPEPDGTNGTQPSAAKPENQSSGTPTQQRGRGKALTEEDIATAIARTRASITDAARLAGSLLAETPDDLVEHDPYPGTVAPPQTIPEETIIVEWDASGGRLETKWPMTDEGVNWATVRRRWNLRPAVVRVEARYKTGGAQTFLPLLPSIRGRFIEQLSYVTAAWVDGPRNPATVLEDWLRQAGVAVLSDDRYGGLRNSQTKFLAISYLRGSLFYIDWLLKRLDSAAKAIDRLARGHSWVDAVTEAQRPADLDKVFAQIEKRCADELSAMLTYSEDKLRSAANGAYATLETWLTPTAEWLVSADDQDKKRNGAPVQGPVELYEFSRVRLGLFLGEGAAGESTVYPRRSMAWATLVESTAAVATSITNFWGDRLRDNILKEMLQESTWKLIKDEELHAPLTKDHISNLLDRQIHALWVDERVVIPQFEIRRDLEVSHFFAQVRDSLTYLMRAAGPVLAIATLLFGGVGLPKLIKALREDLVSGVTSGFFFTIGMLVAFGVIAYFVMRNVHKDDLEDANIRAREALLKRARKALDDFVADCTKALQANTRASLADTMRRLRSTLSVQASRDRQEWERKAKEIDERQFQAKERQEKIDEARKAVKDQHKRLTSDLAKLGQDVLKEC